MNRNNPIFTIIAGVNGSGKTTFALDYFKNKQTTFINADLIATGLSPNNPDISQFLAGKLMLTEIKKYIKRRYNRSISNLINDYLPLIDDVTCFDNSNNRSLVFKKQYNKIKTDNKTIYENILEYRDVR